jgi:hypothetical protein
MIGGDHAPFNFDTTICKSTTYLIAYLIMMPKGI